MFIETIISIWLSLLFGLWRQDLTMKPRLASDSEVLVLEVRATMTTSRIVFVCVCVWFYFCFMWYSALTSYVFVDILD